FRIGYTFALNPFENKTNLRAYLTVNFCEPVSRLDTHICQLETFVNLMVIPAQFYRT
ncbi:27275_t:CDS:1, partial [Racocetra persica]